MTLRRRKIRLPRFNLKEPKSKYDTLIYLIYRYKLNSGGEPLRLKYSTTKKVKPKYWKNSEAIENSLTLSDNQRARHKELNSFLRSLKNEAIRIVSVEPHISPIEFKNRLDVLNGINIPTESIIPSLPEFMTTYIEKANVDQRTKDKFLGTQRKLKQYEVERSVTVTFDFVNVDFSRDFQKYLYKNGVQSQNTISKHFQIIRQMMSEAEIESISINGKLNPLHTNKDYNRKEFNIKRVKTTKHFLHLEELEILSKYKPDKESHNIVKDYFMAMCYTGLRISDITTLSKENFFKDSEGSEFIQLFTFKGRNTKSDNEVVIPVLPEMKVLMDKYNYRLPDALSEQKHNNYIKEIIKSAGIDRYALHKDATQGRIVETVSIADKISNHSGRYTFINFMMNDHGITAERMMKITGQSLKVLLGYESGDKKKNAKAVLSKITPQMNVVKSIIG
jgi:integrase